MGAVGADQEQVHVQVLEFLGVFHVEAGVAALLLQGTKTAIELLQDVIQALDILQRALKLLVRLVLAGAELDDAGGLLKDLAAILGFAGQDLINAALADDGVALLADAGIAEQINDVAQTAGRTVEEVLALAVAVDAAGHHDLRVLHGELAVLVIEDQRHFAVGQRLTLLGAVEDDVRHGRTAQRLRTLLTQHPAHCVADIALA